ncbi:MAG: phosphatidate cytidylyltransferase [Spirochaetia bacterium]|nr:phosphatidate cytidylyltransferase [Spirochaetia bacterium]
MQRVITVMQQEACRKIIHSLIVFVPFIAGYSYTLAYLLLFCGIIVYSWSEYQRLAGHYVPVLSDIKEKAFRTRDINHFAKAPVTLALGAMGALALYPMPAAAVAIYALAFGDTAACLVGKSIGKTKIPGTGKTWTGSAACLVTVFVLALCTSGCSLSKAFAVALAATLTELFPVKDYDNLLIPLVTGLAFVLL